MIDAVEDTNVIMIPSEVLSTLMEKYPKIEAYLYSFGFYSLMLTSTLIGLIVMVLYKPRTWCTFCPMGTMTQGICKLKHQAKERM